VIEKEIKYSDWDGKPTSKTYYFHLSKAKIVEMKLSLDAENDTQGVDDYFKQIINAKSAVEALQLFKDLVKMAIGQMAEINDSKRFIQNDDIWDEFTQTGAYSEFFMELLQDPTYAGRFFISILPADFAEEVKKKQDQLQLPGLDGVKPEPQVKRLAEDYTQEELVNLPKEEFDELFAQSKHPVAKHVITAAMQRIGRDEQGQKL
jgi:hypothetical protein